MIFLDAAATTPVRREVIEAMFPFLTSQFGNPSSHHELGHTAAEALGAARADVAGVLGAAPGEIIFTAGGTEADNLALKGIALARRAADPRRTRVLVSAVEHSAVAESADYLRRIHGFTVDVVPVDGEGRVSVDGFARMLDGGSPAGAGTVAVASVMYANNEVGTIQDIPALAAVARERGVPFHTDAVQAAGWLELDVRRLGVDALAISGHKLGAPKGVGALYVRAGTPVEPLVHGGGQERGTRSGTENVAFAVALATALRLGKERGSAVGPRVAGLRDAFIARVEGSVPGARLTGPRQNRLPSVASFCFPGTSGESVLLELERKGIVCSSGSACAAGSDRPSPVLTAMGVGREEAQTALRFSFGAEITEEELDSTADALAGAVRQIQGLASGRYRG